MVHVDRRRIYMRIKSVQNVADRCEMGSVTNAEAYDGVRDWMWDRGEDVTKAV
jgi:hypothetical protein